MPQTLGIIQARVSSQRFPGKVLQPIEGQPMILHEYQRARRAKQLDEVVIATSRDKSDQPLRDLCQNKKIPFYAGSLEDVLDRFYQAARRQKAVTVVRLTGDCPFMDPDVIDAVVNFFRKGKYDYASNCLIPTFPDGLDVEVFAFSALQKAWKDAQRPSEREHVTSYIWKHPELFRLGNYAGRPNLSHWRWTVDERADFRLARAVYEKLYSRFPHFGWKKVAALMRRHPALVKINQSINRNEGYRRSVLKDGSRGNEKKV